MVRRRGIRRHLTRNRSIALAVAIGAFAIVGISGVDIGIDIIQAGFYEGSEFSVTIFENIIPLAFIQNFALTCEIWTEAELVFIDGTSRDLGRSENTFTQSAFLSVIDPITQKEVTRINGEIRARCQSPASIDSFRIQSGTVQHVITVTKVGAATERLNFSPQTLTQQNLLTSSASGVLLKTFSFNADLINNAIGTNEETYTVRPALVTQVEMQVTAVADGITDTRSVLVALGSWNNLAFTINNDFFDPNFTPVGQPIFLVNHQNSISGRGDSFKLDDPSLDLVLQVDLPNFDLAFENIPKWKINAASPQTGEITGGILGASTIDIKLGNTEYGEVVCLASFGCADKDKTISPLGAGVYITTVFSDARQTEDFELFVVTEDDQSPTIPIPVDPEPPDDPCEGLTGSQLEQCEIARGIILVCDTPTYVKIERALFDVIASTPAVIVNIEPGSAPINDFTTHICLAQATIDLFNELGGAECADPNFIFDDQTSTCVCGFTGSADLGAECGSTVAGTLSAKSLMLFEIAYNGASDVGSIRDVEGADIIFAPLLSLAGEVGAKDEIFALARLQVNPVIDWNDVDPVFGDPKNSIFIFKWTGNVTREGTTEPVALPKALEVCIPNGFDSTKDFTKQSATISPSTTCKIFTMSTVGVVTGGGNLGLRVEGDIQGGRFYQIARSDVQPNEIILALANQNIVLNDGDKFEITVEVEGSFQVGTGSLKRIGVVTPMSFSHEFTWVEVLNPEPCSGLSGEAKIKCLGGSLAAGGTCEGLTALQCYLQNHPVLPKTNPDDPDCRQAFVGGLIKVVCEGDPEEKKSGLGGDPGDDSGGDPGTFGSCASGATATECLKLTISDLQSQITALLGLSGNTITTLSNNAVLIIGVVVAIIVIAIIIQRAAVRTRQKRLGRKLLGL